MNYFIEPLLSSVNGNCTDIAVFLVNISDIYLLLFFNSNLWWKYSQYFFKADIQLSFLTKARSLNQILTICDTAVYPNHLLPMSLCHFLKKKVSIRGAISVGFGDWKVGFTRKMEEEKGKITSSFGFSWRNSVRIWPELTSKVGLLFLFRDRFLWREIFRCFLHFQGGTQQNLNQWFRITTASNEAVKRSYFFLIIHCLLLGFCNLLKSSHIISFQGFTQFLV